MVFPAVRAQSARICCGKSMLFLGLFFRPLWRLCRRFDLTCLLAGRLTLSLCSTLMWFVSVVDYRLPTPLFAGFPTTPGQFCISSLAFFYGFPTAFVWRSRLVCCPLLLLFCWRAIRQARHGCQSDPPEIRIPQYAVFIVNVADRLPTICGSASPKDSTWLTKAIYALSFSLRAGELLYFYF